MNYRLSASLLSLSAAIATPALAQDAENEAAPGNTIIITAQADNSSQVDNGGDAGALGDKPAEDLPFAVRSYDESLILNQQPQTLGEVLGRPTVAPLPKVALGLPPWLGALVGGLG